MNLNFLIKKNHIFKRRKLYKTYYLRKFLNDGGIYSLTRFRFEFVYLRIIRKMFRKKHRKKTVQYNRSRFWVMIRPNFLLTMKSKNSRMGSGVGKYVRVCFIVKPNRPIILFRFYSKQIILNIIRYFKKKINITFLEHY